MTPAQWADLTMCDWNRLLNFIRRKHPKTGKYGTEAGKVQAVALVASFQNMDEMARISGALFSIDSKHKATVDPLVEKIRKADRDREDAERLLLDTVT